MPNYIMEVKLASTKVIVINCYPSKVLFKSFFLSIIIRSDKEMFFDKPT